MIGRLQGVLLEKQSPELLLDVNGVGYELQAPLSTFFELPETGSAVTLHIHHVVREDAQVLYAFAEKRERRLFRALIKVNGVGPKLALTILSGIEADQFVSCVHHNDTAALVKLPGVGKKTAERLLVEMRDRLADWDVASPAASSGVAAVAAGGQSHIVDEAESALLALGYKPQEASKAISRIPQADYSSSEQLIRQALKSMVKS